MRKGRSAMPGIAAGTSKTDFLPLQKNDVNAGPGQFERGSETRVPGTDDANIGFDATGERFRQRRGSGRRIPERDVKGRERSHQPALSIQIAAGIERVAKSVAYEVETRDGECDGDTGDDGEPGRLVEILLGTVQHVAPAWQRRLNAVTQKTDVGLKKNGARHRQRRRDDDGPGSIWQ
ncbi:hypothetical protein D3C72_1841440 [compost metagenome]